MQKLILTILFLSTTLTLFSQVKYKLSDTKYDYSYGVLNDKKNKPITGIVYGEYEGEINYFAYYSDGKKNGISKKQYPNGQLMFEESWKSGKLDGPQKYWYLNGKIKEESYYLNGINEGDKILWHPNGVMASKQKLIDGDIDGQYFEWWDNGKVKRDWIYEKGKFNGIQKEWDSEGNKLFIDSFSNGYLMGIQKSWYKNGVLKSEIDYKYDKIISVKEWDINGVLKVDKNNNEEIKSIICQNKTDRDLDGICDLEDYCVEIAGPPFNGGCPLENGIANSGFSNAVVEFPELEAEFSGGENELRRFLSENVKFPDICLDMNSYGLVFMKFVIEKNGAITNIELEINKTNCDGFVEEMERVLFKIPRFVSAQKYGINVRSQLRMPFNFKM
jgi:antitoxin component YwqK of YwqJK toxin-antitoxin module